MLDKNMMEGIRSRLLLDPNLLSIFPLATYPLGIPIHEAALRKASLPVILMRCIQVDDLDDDLFEMRLTFEIHDEERTSKKIRDISDAIYKSIAYKPFSITDGEIISISYLGITYSVTNQKDLFHGISLYRVVCEAT